MKFGRRGKFRHGVLLAGLALAFCGQVAFPTPAAAETQWGALAYNDRGATGLVWRRASQARAEQDAMEICARNATLPCRVVSGAGHACIAAALAGRGSRQRGYAQVRVGLNAARNAALAACYGDGQTSCAIRNVLCADGSHRS